MWLTTATEGRIACDHEGCTERVAHPKSAGVDGEGACDRCAGRHTKVCDLEHVAALRALGGGR